MPKTDSKDIDKLIARTEKGVSDGVLRLATNHYRELGEPEQVQYNYVKCADGTHEIRIRRA